MIPWLRSEISTICYFDWVRSKGPTFRETPPLTYGGHYELTCGKKKVLKPPTELQSLLIIPTMSLPLATKEISAHPGKNAVTSPTDKVAMQADIDRKASLSLPFSMTTQSDTPSPLHRCASMVLSKRSGKTDTQIMSR